MPTTNTFRHHADLVDRMAQTLGLDLDETIMEGRMQEQTRENAVLRCTGCADVGGCERWLADQPQSAEEAPGMCRNGTLFALLKAGKHL
jgi:hypothetical protein